MEERTGGDEEEINSKIIEDVPIDQNNTKEKKENKPTDVEIRPPPPFPQKL